MPIVVIMSVYKNDIAAQLNKAILSILRQTHPITLYIYIDGPLREECLRVIDEHNQHDSVRVFPNKHNQGLAVALNTMIDAALEAGFSYIARMDSDDISMTQRIAKQYAYMESHPEVGVLGTDCREFGSRFAIPHKSLPAKHHELLNFSVYRCPMIHPSVMFRSSCFKDGQRYPTHTELTEDMALWYALLLKGIQFNNLNEVLLEFYLPESTLYRRRGFKKCLSEMQVRFAFMRKSRNVSINNTVMIVIKGLFHLLPVTIMQFLYKRYR